MKASNVGLAENQNIKFEGNGEVVLTDKYGNETFLFTCDLATIATWALANDLIAKGAGGFSHTEQSMHPITP